jgi:dTDP-4-amino-4,6-dideoxygalactose transaminase
LAAACSRQSIKLVIDNAAGLGVDREVVSRLSIPGAIEVFSLHATKPFGIGEGGVVMCPPAMEDDIRSALNFGLWSAGSLERGRGINGKMDELSAAMARAVLARLPPRIAQRQKMAARYNELCSSRLSGFSQPGAEDRAPWQCYPLRLPDGLDADLVTKTATANGLALRRYYHPSLRTGSSPAPPNAHALGERMVCLPIYDDPAAIETADEIWALFMAALSS